jgi:NAD(P)-dependent dehydrogenase (short-subunit alcohol dehydrogenase family)
MDLNIAGKVAVVTGAAKGIGAAISQAFLKEDASVAMLDVDDAGEALAAQLGPRAKFFRCNVALGESVASAMKSVCDAFGGIDVLVNNAGIQTYGTVTDTSEELWDRTLSVNLKGAFLCAKHAIPSMQQRGKGVVINMASVQSFISQAKVASYTTSKTALLGLTRSIAIDYAPAIRCVAICPGTVDTPMLAWAVNQSPDPAGVLKECDDMHPLKRIAKPEEVAALVTFLASDCAGFITGQYVRIDGGLGISAGGSKRD